MLWETGGVGREMEVYEHSTVESTSRSPTRNYTLDLSHARTQLRRRRVLKRRHNVLPEL